MSDFKFEDIRLSSSAVDDFLPDDLTIRTASTGKIRVGSLRQLAGFQLIADDQLIHLSRQDFWKLGEDEDGYFIERLVSDDDGPVKE